ncbi:MAG: RagB/SusD family nutrient uptake outer membrane protein [Prevotellaceae bacterium]|nr:RagB/SusD family nutrient uptake outer membrane protein [Prevotellaceae bacterium]
MKKNIYNSIMAVAMFAMAFTFASCDDWLDKSPDDRADLTETGDKSSKDYEKINYIITSAYPECSTAFLAEMSSDNVDDVQYYAATKASYSSAQKEMFLFKQVIDEDWDTPYWLWNYYYKAIATANTALEAIDEIGAENLKAQRAEALLCRAYSMMKLAEVFCMAYDPTKADTLLGLYYPKSVIEDITLVPERGTLAELYANIDADIEEAVGGDVPMLNENHMSVPKYHFNLKAAYAFAARFNLYYQKWQKAADYATKALGASPETSLRDLSGYKLEAAGAEDIFNMYIRSSNNCNFMIMNAYSLAGRSGGSYNRFNHNSWIVNNETYSAKCIFGAGSTGLFYWCDMLYIYSGNEAAYSFFPKFIEKFEYTDKIAGTGTPHVVDCVFTGDETILVRAEAYAHLKQYQKAYDDLNKWAVPHTKPRAGILDSRPILSAESIAESLEDVEYANPIPENTRQRTLRKKLHPQGFTVEAGEQENLIHMILHFRRLETLFQGLRFYDLKRYGIEYTHFVDKADHIDPVTFKAGDLRGAVQLPQAVINSGIQPNPREDEK